ncbi:MAG TPA: POTRA domain-containing protein, partial [Enterobacteriaceae bacterium]|nr:POTRA domain-containing protein [Enterobacteriaceae bacterium]
MTDTFQGRGTQSMQGNYLSTSAGSALSGIYLACSVLLALGIGSFPCAVAAAETADPGASVRVNIREYIVRGNSVLDAETIELAVYPWLGPERKMSDIEGARDALQKIYSDRGYESVYVDLPEQNVVSGVVILQVSETRVGRLRVTGAEHRSPMEIRDRVPALKEGEVPDFKLA